MKRLEDTINSMLHYAGVKLNGQGEADILVRNPDFYKRVLHENELGLGESYMDGWWDVKKLDVFIYHVLNASLDKKIKSWKLLPYFLKSRITNYGKKSKAFEIGKKHYDIGNTLYQKMLDKRMVYSCGYWKNARNLDEAQEAKLHLICRKLDLKAGMKVLDIGCGWGSFCKYAAENFGVEVEGITVSKEQVSLGKELCKDLKVNIKFQDYRDLCQEGLNGSESYFDRIVSIGMIEHVGYKNYRTFMEITHKLLKDDGLFLLQTIGRNKSTVAINPWTNKYIFPNSMLPSIRQLGASFEGLFVMEDWHNFGKDYDKTLMAWYENFEHSWDALKLEYDERFYRMWKYYLLSSAGDFRARRSQVWQIVFSKNGVPGGYQSIR